MKNNPKTNFGHGVADTDDISIGISDDGQRYVIQHDPSGETFELGANGAEAGSLSSGELFTSEPITGPEGSTVGTRGGVPTTVTPTVDLIPGSTETQKVVQYQSGDTLYATQNLISNDAEVHKSTDRGNSWTQQGTVGVAIGDAQLMRLESTGTLLLVTGDNDLWRSTDDGATWTETDTSIDDSATLLEGQSFAETPSGDFIVVERTSTTNSHGDRIFKSTDDGQSLTVAHQFDSAEGHAHCIQFDPFDTQSPPRAVVFNHDDVTNTGGGRTYVSEDEGDTWSLISANDNDFDPFFVSVMFFEDYIAWGTDRTGSIEMGWILRLPRDDFYSGNWGGLNGNVESVGKVSSRSFWYTHRISSDKWLITLGESAEGNEYGGMQKCYVVYDNAQLLSGGFHYAPESYPTNDPSDSVPIEYPAMRYDTHAGGRTWVNIRTLGGIAQNSGVAAHLGETSNMSTYTDTAFGDLVVPKDSAVRATRSDGTRTNILEYDAENEQTKLFNKVAGGNVTINDSGYLEYRNNGVAVRMATETVKLAKNQRVTGLGNGSGAFPGVKFENGAGFYVNSSGEVVAVDESGNETTLT